MLRPSLYRLAMSATFTLCVAVAGLCLFSWFTLDPAAELKVNLPGRDGRPEVQEEQVLAVDLKGTFQAFDSVPASLPGAWPRFRGADFDNICKNTTPLARQWPPSGPEQLWALELGEGHAAPVVLDGRVYLIDYDEEARTDAIRCFSLADGKEIWRRSYAVAMKRNHGMSRTVPAVTESSLVTIGPRCHVVCLDPVTGDFRWGIDLQREYGTVEPLWYTGQCPLIDGANVILAPGGPDALLMAVDAQSGAVAWKTPNPQGWNMSHSSVIPMTVAGVRMYVYCAIGGVVGVGAEGGETGQILWEVPWNARVIAPSPVPIEGERILVAAGYGNGNMMLKLRNEGGALTPEILYQQSPKEGIACEQQTPIYHAGLLYAIMPKDAGALKGQFVCYDPDGRLVWSSGAENRYGLGPFLLADGKFYVLSDDGVLTLLEASTESFVQLDQARVLDGQDAWGPIAIAGSRMLVRDSVKMVCIDVGVPGEERSS